MVFSSLSFIFLFIPLCLVLYFPLKNRTWRNSVLLAVSLLFYSWGEPRFVVFMLLASLAAYFGALLIDREQPRVTKKLFFIITVVLITANLFVFKYLNFFAGNIEKLFGVDFGIPEITLPIGISFYTFQILSYVIDLYRGQVRLQKNFFNLLLYVSFFPQLIAGPIVRYSTIEDELRNRHESFDDAVCGVKRFITGLAKKVIISNGVAHVAVIIYEGDPSVYGTAGYWLAAVAYTLQIYFDFSGYSDMAIGLGRIFGFHFLENFDHPYISRSVTEFWRRWHMSLSGWFRDYIYIPLGGNRVSKGRWMLNILIVWVLTGFWHGASWNFVLWGLYYGIILMLEKLFLQKALKKIPGIFRWFYTMLVVTVGWVIFNLTDFSQMSAALAMMFTPHGTGLADIVTANSEILEALIYVPLGLVCMLPLGRLLQNIKKELFRGDPWPAVLLEDAWYLALLAVCVVFILSSSFNPFIYFRF